MARRAAAGLSRLRPGTADSSANPPLTGGTVLVVDQCGTYPECSCIACSDLLSKTTFYSPAEPIMPPWESVPHASPLQHFDSLSPYPAISVDFL